MSGVSLETIVVEKGGAKITAAMAKEAAPRKNPSMTSSPGRAHGSSASGRDGRNLSERHLYDVVGDAPLHVDTIAGRSGTSTVEAIVHLLALEFAGTVRQRAARPSLGAEMQFSCRGLFSSQKVIFYDMFLIGNAVIDDPVAEAKFCCDIESCKGGCCTLEGLRGAPLEDIEVAEVRRALPAIRRYLSQESLREIEAIGPVEGAPGEYATPCIGNRECVYVSFVGGIAMCSFERAFLDGAITWRKPISCHLFPIRIRGFGQDYVRYEMIDECAAGRSRGEKEGIRLWDFLKNPLTRRFGPDWYRTFVEECRRQDGHRPAGEPAIE